MFNVLFVVGLSESQSDSQFGRSAFVAPPLRCGWVAKGNIDLTWWPLFRDWASVGWQNSKSQQGTRLEGSGRHSDKLVQDCSYYIVSLAVLAAFVSDQYVKPWEVGRRSS